MRFSGVAVRRRRVDSGRCRCDFRQGLHAAYAFAPPEDWAIMPGLIVLTLGRSAVRSR